MLIAHGAYPKGFCDFREEIAKVLCITRCAVTEKDVFERHIDLIMGCVSTTSKNCHVTVLIQENVYSRPDCEVEDNISFQIAPDTRYAKVYFEIMPKDERDDHIYNKYEDVQELVQYCQRELDVDQLFVDQRLFVLSTNDLATQFVPRNQESVQRCHVTEKAKRDCEKILERLRQSRYQTRESFAYAKFVIEKQMSQLGCLRS